MRPTERAVVHHLIAFVREPKSKWFRGQPAGVFFTAPKVSTDEETEVGALPSDFLVGYAPGQPAEILEPGQGKLIKAGSDIVFQMHYTPHGHARSDRTRLGIVFAKQPPKERVLTLSAVNDTFKIPPGHPNYRVDASFEVGADVKLASLHPHMHGRGKDFEYRVVFPSGKTEILLKVPRFDWHWQNWYNLEKPIALPKGTRIDCTAHFDNSPNNPEAADPTKEVTWGDQSWDEMMIGFFNLVFDASLPVDKLFVKKPKAEIAGGTRRIIALAEPGQTIHQPFADAALRWLQETAPKEGFTVDYIRTTDPIDDAYPGGARPVRSGQLSAVPLDAGRRGRVQEGDGAGDDRVGGLPPRVAARQVRRLRDVALLPSVHGQHRLQELHPRLRDRDGPRRGPGASGASRDCRRHSRSRTTSGTPTTDRLGPTCTCSRTSMRTATCRRAA